MKFYYDKKNAEKYQRLNFPRLFWAEEMIQDDPQSLFDAGFVKEGEVIQNTHQWLKNMKEKVKPFGKRIEKYYGETWLDIHLYDPLMKTLDLFEEESVFTWLQKAMLLSEKSLRVIMLKYVWRYVEETEGDQLTRQEEEKIETIAADMSRWNHFLEENLLSKEACWRVLQFLINPIESIKGLYDLLYELDSLYTAEQEKIEEAHTNGLKLCQELNKDIRYLGLSFSLQSDEIYQEVAREGKIRVLSLFAPNLVSIKANPPYMAVGYLVNFSLHLMEMWQKNAHRQQAEIFKVLGDTTRYELLILITQGVSTAKDLAERLNISGPSVTYHIQMLVEANLLHSNWRKRAPEDRINKEKILAIGKHLQEDLGITKT